MVPSSLATERAFAIDGSDLLKALHTSAPLRALGALTGRARSSALPGLGNWDNSCYQNSVIQSLASLRSLTEFLSKITEEAGGLDEELDDDTTINALQETISKLNDVSRRGTTMWMPKKLKSMSSWEQQDAQEYFSKVVDQIKNDVASMHRSPPPSHGLEVIHDFELVDPKLEQGLRLDGISLTGNGTYSQSTYSDEGVDATHASKPQDPLEGFLGQRVACLTCGFTEGLSLIPFNCLTVSLGHKGFYDVRECLDEYTKLEVIDEVECAKCTLLRLQKNLRMVATMASEGGADGMASLEDSALTRLANVERALEDEDFSDIALNKRCHVPKNRVSSAKTRQAVVAKPPKNLVIHINRSVFDEYTGDQRKNNALVSFPKDLDLGWWCLGRVAGESTAPPGISKELWSLDPRESLLDGIPSDPDGAIYELRAVVTHYGHHENGHYICYRKQASAPLQNSEDDPYEQKMYTKETPQESWWRLSDEDVSPVSEDHVLRQVGVFMLFYEKKITQPFASSSEKMDTSPDVVDISAEEVNTEALLTAQGDEDDLKGANAEQNSADLGFELRPPKITMETYEEEPIATTKLISSELNPDSVSSAAANAGASSSPPTESLPESTSSSISESEASPSLLERIASGQTQRVILPPLDHPMRTSRSSNSGRKDGSFSSPHVPMVTAT
ncbi:MAG: hypothetical protein M1820_001986 [Bogoriella megaspora]|nr:MAG: hypothetical protein M1820_001986 [Bogoriella megaspora]